MSIVDHLEFLDGFRTNSTFQQQDRDKLINLASSLTSFFDHAGITNLAQSRIAGQISKKTILLVCSISGFSGDSSAVNRLPNLSNRTVNHVRRFFRNEFHRSSLLLIVQFSSS